MISFAVVAIGGLGSVGGAALGALLVGLARAAAVHLFPELDLFAIYLIMALVLLVRPPAISSPTSPSGPSRATWSSSPSWAGPAA